VLAALQANGWSISRRAESHLTLTRDGFPETVFAFPHNEMLGPVMLARLAEKTGLTPEQLVRVLTRL
jgi:hypothetical protein